MAATLDGVRIMKPETAKLAMSNLLPAGVIFGGVGWRHRRHDGADDGLRRGRIGLSWRTARRLRRKGTYGWGGAAGTVACVDPVKQAARHGDGQLLPRREMAGPRRDGDGAASRRGALRAMTPMIAPGFTGSPLDRADRLRHDADALAAAMGDWRARLLQLDGFDPEVTDDGRLGWTSLADAPDDAELVLLGLIDGTPHFAAAIPGAARRRRAARRACSRCSTGCAPGEAATYAAARSVLDWHARHRFCANCGHADRDVPRRLGAAMPDCGDRAFPAHRPGRDHDRRA